MHIANYIAPYFAANTNLFHADAKIMTCYNKVSGILSNLHFFTKCLMVPLSVSRAS